MRGINAPSLRLVPLLVLGVLLLLIAAWPDGFFRKSSLPATLEHAAPFRAFLAKIQEWPSEPPVDSPALLAHVQSDPLGGSETIDVGIRRLACTESSFGACARILADLANPRGEALPVTGGTHPQLALPVRRIAAVGAIGASIHAISAQNSSRFPTAFRDALARLIDAVEAANSAVTADRPVSDAAATVELLRSFASRHENAGVSDRVRAQVESVVAAFDGMTLLAIAIELSDAVDSVRNVLASLADDPAFNGLPSLPEGDGIPRHLLFASECDAGLVLVGDLASTVIPLAGVAVAIDLGGEDLWHSMASFGTVEYPDARVRVMIDCAGRDRFEGTESGPGSTTGGITLLLDLGGDDVYESGRCGFAAAEYGVALQIDVEGDDRYACAERGIGFATFGAVLLLDAAGDDSYRGERSVIASADVGGLAVVVDQRGSDLYITDRSTDDQGFLTTGAARGFESTGAVALFVDGGGDDSYRIGRGAGGFGCDVGLAVCVDAAGDDLYSGSAWCLGTARARGYGWFRDFDGVDEYLAREYSLGSASRGVGIFIDDSGRDSVLALDPSRGAATDGATALFVDVDSTAKTRRADDRKSFER